MNIAPIVYQCNIRKNDISFHANNHKEIEANSMQLKTEPTKQLGLFFEEKLIKIPKSTDINAKIKKLFEYMKLPLVKTLLTIAILFIAGVYRYQHKGNAKYNEQTKKELMTIYTSQESDGGDILTLDEAKELKKILREKNNILGKYSHLQRGVYEEYHKTLIKTCSRKGKFSPDGIKMINTLLTEFTKQKPRYKYNFSEWYNQDYEMRLRKHYREGLLHRYSYILVNSDGNINKTALSNYMKFLNEIDKTLNKCPKENCQDVLYDLCYKANDLISPTTEKEEALLEWLKTTVNNYKRCK